MDGEQPRKPADLPLVTLDNNVFIALRRDEANAAAARALLELNRAGLISINVTMSTGMEAQRPDEWGEWQKHIAWLESLGITLGNIFTGARSVGFTTPGAPNTITFDPQLEIRLMERIHVILFPNIPFSWFAYRHRETADLTDTVEQALLELEDLRHGPIRIPPLPTPALDGLADDEREHLRARLERLHRTWLNAKNDALGLYNHLTLAWYTAQPSRRARRRRRAGS
jgi:hypothetical protein